MKIIKSLFIFFVNEFKLTILLLDISAAVSFNLRRLLFVCQLQHYLRCYSMLENFILCVRVNDFLKAFEENLPLA